MRRIIFALCGLVPFAHHAGATSLEMSAPLEQGTAVFLHVKDFTPGAKLAGELNSKPFPITSDGLALIALDMEAPPGTKTIRVSIEKPDGVTDTVSKQIVVNKRTYKEEHISLPEKKVDIKDKSDEERVRIETEAIKATFKLRDGQVGFADGFKQPVDGRFSGVFGSRRILNGKPKRPHNGVDIAAPKGTPVPTTAPGKVVLVGENYILTGNTVVLHHGHGVISLYAHLDYVTVTLGEWVSAGQPIGRVGTTGRSTGPHLHWGVLVREERVDPMRLPGLPH